MPPVTRLVIAIVVLLAPVLLGGCGGSARPDAAELLADTFGAGHPIEVGRVDATLRVAGSGAGLGEPFVLGVTGPFDATVPDRLPRFALEFQFGPKAPAAGLVSTGTKGFVTFEGQPFLLSASAYERMQRAYGETRRRDAERRDRARGGLAALGVDPSRWIEGARVDGERDVAGTRVTHIAGRVDVAALLGDVDRILRRTRTLPRTAQTEGVPGRLDPQVKAAIERSVRTATIAVDTGSKDRTLRRLRLQLRLTVAEADRLPLGGLRTLDVDLDVALAQLGQPQAIAAPKDARPAAELTRALAALAARASQTPAAGTYGDCVARAGSDLRKLQSCAPLAGAQ